MERSSIREMTLRAREVLTKEVEELLRGVYGLDDRGRFEDAGKLPAVRSLEEARETRRRLESHISDQEGAGLSRQEAVRKLIKEVAFTHLNRLVAFKMLEARKLIRGTLDRYQDSNAFKLYIADHDDDYHLYIRGNMPQNEMGEGPRDIAYRHFLLWQCENLSKEIKVLFDPDSLASRLFPRPKVLSSLIEMLNDPDLEAAWREEETIGWVYQYFNENEKKDVFDRLYKKKQKVKPEDIPAATQLYTPRWIVRFLVQNTLGRLWMQMHPDSRLIERLDYFVPLAGDVPAEKPKPVREIQVLDPACGTMHFGLVAFDLLAEMYKEEMERAGQPGWPERPSVSSEEEIPAAIIANNIFGIDLDLRAVQLSALALYLRAKSMNPKVQIVESNLACADLHVPEDSKLEEFLMASRFTLPVYERIIRRLWGIMRGGSGKGVGSLLPLELAITSEVERERRAHLTSLQRFEDLADAPQELAATNAWGPEFWDALEDQIAMAFDEFARRHAALGGGESYFVGEARKGMRLLDIMRRRYDCVFTNPPYMTRRNMNPELADFTEANYPEGKGDLYTAFIQRCLEMVREGGRMGMIAQQSFMFISSYEELREELLKAIAIEAVVHTGPRAFDEVSGEKVNTTLLVVRREPDRKMRFDACGTYFRLVREPDSESKRLRFEQALARLRAGESDPAVFRYRQSDFDSIPGSPWVYWITPGLRRLFVELPKLGEVAAPKHGMTTGDNFRFLRFWWEVGASRIAFGCRSHDDARASGKRWFPYMKGGSFRRWYGNQEYVVNWAKDGSEIKNLGVEAGRVASRPQNTEFYFRRGVTWTDITSARFSARLSPEGFIFDHAGNCFFPQNVEFLLGVVNSNLAFYIFNIINHTIHVEVGDLARLPIPTRSSERLERLVERAIALAQADAAEDETTFDFIAPPWTGSLKDTITEILLRHESLQDVEREIDEEVYRLYAISEEDRRAIEAELEGGDEEQCEIDEEELALRWIDYCVGIVMGRFSPGVPHALGRGRFSPERAERLLSLADKDGVATLDEGHQDDLARKVWEALEIALGEHGASEIIETALGEGHPEMLLRDYLKRDFWKRHLQQYRKRPIYWLLQSPNRSFSVYVFHERATRDTLPLILGMRYVAGRINQLRNRIIETQKEMESAEGRARRTLEKHLDNLSDMLSDVEEFEKRIRRVLELRNERGETVGWAPEIDDGVMLNLAPLRELIPWSEPQRFWRELEEGRYDWSRTAMRYWPDRVLEKCRSNRSYAIAHGLEDVHVGNGRG
ncbi:MAG: BREX-1 system adenine-specific DNA-methyltransferase PglX [Methanothrix sp.]